MAYLLMFIFFNERNFFLLLLFKKEFFCWSKFYYNDGIKEQQIGPQHTVCKECIFTIFFRDAYSASSPLFLSKLISNIHISLRIITIANLLFEKRTHFFRFCLVMGRAFWRRRGTLGSYFKIESKFGKIKANST